MVPRRYFETVHSQRSEVTHAELVAAALPRSLPVSAPRAEYSLPLRASPPRASTFVSARHTLCLSGVAPCVRSAANSRAMTIGEDRKGEHWKSKRRLRLAERGSR